MSLSHKRPMTISSAFPGAASDPPWDDNLPEDSDHEDLSESSGHDEDLSESSDHEDATDDEPRGRPAAGVFGGSAGEEGAPTPRGDDAAETDWQPRKNTLLLLDLPVDILRLIIKEVAHTNDLTSLALTHSILHALAIPQIYAKFDIVWPEGQVTTDDPKSVDALTFGLSTLCLGSTFARRARHLRDQRGGPPRGPRRGQRLGRSNYAQYTRKFALGNGPPEWVSEYIIWKESGKMLGTLVALAIERMVNLETFIWDMPTGVLSEVFLSLSCLQDHSADGSCKLESVSIRWHENPASAVTSQSPNADVSPPPPPLPVPSTLTPIGYALPPETRSRERLPPRMSYRDSRVEYPTFSVLPPLRSLTVLDIDELAYLDEMAVLVSRSASVLRELKVGISAKAASASFVETWDGPDLHQVDRNAEWPGESSIRNERLGGVLGVLVGWIYDLRRKPAAARLENSPYASQVPDDDPLDGTVTGDGAGKAGADDAALNEDDACRTASGPARMAGNSEDGECSGCRGLDGKLRLRTLELERVPLSIQVCSKALDWSMLSSLTLLECRHSDTLWKVLGRQFGPLSSSPPAGLGFGRMSLQHQLCLKKIHTDMPSPALMAFLRETLAPNTLEVLFLQDRRPAASAPPIPVDMIFRGPIRRHKSSLRKLMLDSSNNVVMGNQRWRNWVPTTEMLLYMTSGRLTNLRELSIYMDHKDWHVFLRRLPNLPQLRSLNLPGVYPAIVLASELAHQVVDVASLRPEVKLCYVGINNQCFEILETPNVGCCTPDTPADTEATLEASSGNVVYVLSNGEDDADADDSEWESEEGGGGSEGDGEVDGEGGGEEGDGDNGEALEFDPGPGADETQSEASYGGASICSSDPGETEKRTPGLRLREIFFYDDKVEIFKARHGRLSGT